MSRADARVDRKGSLLGNGWDTVEQTDIDAERVWTRATHWWENDPEMVQSDPFLTIQQSIDLRKAVVPASEPNDLIPPRPDDKVGGNVGKRFVRSLERSIKRAEYAPSPAILVRVPKSGVSTRPAAVMSLEDKCVYHAIVSELTASIEATLPGDQVVFWPRAVPSKKRWNEFNQLPLTIQGDYVVRADIAGFYESISHDVLARRLTAATGKADHVDALIYFLGRLMKKRRGIPQGIATSDTLATAYLTPVDWAALRAGITYFRHGDDIRIVSDSYTAARNAIALLETELQDLELILNSAKSWPLRKGTYAKGLKDVNDAFKEWEENLREITIESLLEDEDGDTDAIQEVFNELGLDDELLWDVFYHGTADLDDVAEALREHLTPQAVDVAAAMLDEAMDRAPGKKNAFGDEAFHGRVITSLTVLKAADSPAGLEHCSELLRRFPDKTEAISSYLMALASDRPKRVTKIVAKAIKGVGYMTEWQKAWLLTVVSRVDDIDDATSNLLSEIAKSEEEGWLARSEAARTLGVHGRLDHTLIFSLWQRAPNPFTAYLLAAAIEMSDHAEWAEAFVDSAHMDRIHEIVVERLAS